METIRWIMVWGNRKVWALGLIRFPSPKEIETTVELLTERYKVSSNLLGIIFGIDLRDQANSILPRLGGRRLLREDLTRMIIHRRGSELFSGSDTSIRKLRKYLLKQLPEKELKLLYTRNKSAGKTITSPSYMLTPLSEKNGALASTGLEILSKHSDSL